jgi:uncharacterized protein YqeY
MTSLKERLTTDMRAALKARDEVTTSTLRMALAAVGMAETAGKVKRELSDAEVLAVLKKEAKKRVEAATAFGDAGRVEQAAKERLEEQVLIRYLPQQLSGEEVTAIVTKVISDGGFAGLPALGQAMKAVQAEVAGRADGAKVAAEVRKQLGA